VITVCPTTVAEAPADVVWRLLEPAHLDEWWDAKTRSITPPGNMAVGQRVEARTGPLSVFKIAAAITEVDPAAHRVRIVVTMPFGVTNDETVTLTPLAPDRCRITFS
jgi:hypothetical protein